MIQGGDTSGYTIVETMVFFAVTAILFISAIGLISGRQATVQFSQSTRDAQSKIQDIINQVSSGFYPNDGNFSCSAPAAGRPVLDKTTPAGQGTSNECVFLGKVIQFGVGTDQDQFNVFSVASRRQTAAGDEVSTLAEAIPTAIAPVSALDATNPDQTDKLSFQYGLRVTRVTIPNPVDGTYQGSSYDYGAMAFFGSFPNTTTPGNLTSGAQHVNFGAVPGTDIGDDSFTEVAAINAITSNAGSGHTTLSPDAQYTKGMVICLDDGSNDHQAYLTIGGDVSGTSVKLDIGKSIVCP